MFILEIEIIQATDLNFETHIKHNQFAAQFSWFDTVPGPFQVLGIAYLQFYTYHSYQLPSQHRLIFITRTAHRQIYLLMWKSFKIKS